MSKGEALLIDEMVEEKLIQLQSSLEKLKQTPEGIADLQRRVKASGECERSQGETSVQYYHRLHHWLDRRVPQTKSPIHPPRQTEQ